MKVLRIEGSRLVRMVSLEVMGMRGKVRRVENLKQSMEEIGWMDGWMLEWRNWDGCLILR